MIRSVSMSFPSTGTALPSICVILLMKNLFHHRDTAKSFSPYDFLFFTCPNIPVVFIYLLAESLCLCGSNGLFHHFPDVRDGSRHRGGDDHGGAHQHGAAVLAALAADEIAVGRGGRN